jgi:hypothetical protein
MKPSKLYEAPLARIGERVPLHIWGACGVGKSQIVAQIAGDRDYKFLDVRAVQLDLVDLRGLSWISREIDANVRESLTRGTEDLWRRLREVVAHMVERLNEPESRTMESASEAWSIRDQSAIGVSNRRGLESLNWRQIHGRISGVASGGNAGSPVVVSRRSCLGM